MEGRHRDGGGGAGEECGADSESVGGAGGLVMIEWDCIYG